MLCNTRLLAEETAAASLKICLSSEETFSADTAAKVSVTSLFVNVKVTLLLAVILLLIVILFPDIPLTTEVPEESTEEVTTSPKLILLLAALKPITLLFEIADELVPVVVEGPASKESIPVTASPDETSTCGLTSFSIPSSTQVISPPVAVLLS